MKYTEDQLLFELKKGSQKAVRYWFKHYYSDVFRFVRSKISSAVDAEELAQETFLQGLKQLGLFRGNATLKTWMISIARHEVADYYRKKYAKKALQTIPLFEELLTHKFYNAHDTSEKVAQVLATMSTRSREMLLQKYVDDKKVSELARNFSKSEKAIESELFRARNEFKALFIALE